MSESLNPFAPETNPDYEYIPYDQDPVIQGAIEQNNQVARNLEQRLRAWQDATHELEFRPDDIAAQTSLQVAEGNLESHLVQLGIVRSVREKQPPQE